MCSLINGSPKLYRPSCGAFSDQYYYLSICDKSKKFHSISEFEPKVLVFEKRQFYSSLCEKKVLLQLT